MTEREYKKGHWKGKYFSSLCQRVLEKTLESPLDCKGIQPVHPKGNQSWIFTGRTDAEAETPILCPPDAKNWLIRKDSDAGKDWRREENGMTEDEMVGWHHWLNGHEFEQTLGAGDGQGGLACCSPWGRKESDMTEWMNWTELNCVKHKRSLNKCHVLKEGKTGSCCFNLEVKSVILSDSLNNGLDERNRRIKNNSWVFQRQYCLGLVRDLW